MSDSKVGVALDECVQRHVLLWTIACGMMFTITQEYPNFKNTWYDRGDANLYHQMFALLFAVTSFSFFTWSSFKTTTEGRSVGRALGFVTAIVALMYGVMIPFNISPVFKSINGTPADLANHVEQLLNTPTLIYIMAEVTKARAGASATAYNNYMMMGAGLLASITLNPFSTFFGWIAIGYGTLTLECMDNMFSQAAEGTTGPTINKSILTTVKWIAYAGNIIGIPSSLTLVTLAWGLARFNVINYADGEFYCGAGQFVAKGVFGTALMLGLS